MHFTSEENVSSPPHRMGDVTPSVHIPKGSKKIIVCSALNGKRRQCVKSVGLDFKRNEWMTVEISQLKEGMLTMVNSIADVIFWTFSLLSLNI